MNKLLGAFVTFAGICLVLLGVIFVVAWDVENALTGGAMILVGAGLMYYVYRIEKIEAAKPRLVTQKFEVKMSGSGSMVRKDMVCKTCGAPITEKDVNVVEGGLMATCPYCGMVFAMQEAPKW